MERRSDDGCLTMDNPFDFELAFEQPHERAVRLEREKAAKEEAAEHEYQQRRDDELEDR